MAVWQLLLLGLLSLGSACDTISLTGTRKMVDNIYLPLCSMLTTTKVQLYSYLQNSTIIVTHTPDRT